MTIHDYPEVLLIWKDTKGVSLGQSDTHSSIKHFLARNPGLNFVAIKGDKIVGAILCGHDGRRGYIHHLSVKVGCRKQGIARTLVGRVLGILASKGIPKAHVFVFQSNTVAITTWRHLKWWMASNVRLMSGHTR